MSTWTLAGAFAVFLLLGIFANSYAQQLSDHVVINEVETNPPGDDAKTISEWVELYNPTGQNVDIGGWKVGAATGMKKMLTIPIGTIIKPDQFLTYSYTTLWFSDVSEKVQLLDTLGKVIDETPVITDQKNDFLSWQRKFDGVGTNDSNDWVFKMSSAGSSNGKLETASGSSGDLTISVKTDKTLYNLGDTVTISGSTSKRVTQEKSPYTQQQIVITVSGPEKYEKKITLYPDLNLQFKTQIKLDKVLGVGFGTYKVSVIYGMSQAGAIFSVGQMTTSSVAEERSELTIFTDKSAYLPGEQVKIFANTTKIIPLQGLEYGVFDPNGNRIFVGKLFPTPNGDFSGQIFMTTVNPVYGIITIIADYGKQHAETTFELVKDIKDTQRIVLMTDKQAYGLGEPIIISGRSNKYVAALNLEVLQTGSTAIGEKTSSVFKLNDQIRLAGDSSFSYKLQIPSDKLNLGDYRVTVSKDFGKSEVYFKIVENPQEYSTGGQTAFVSTDKAFYEVGEKLTITGHVLPKTRSTFEAIPVFISVKDQSGKPLTIVGKDKSLVTRDNSLIIPYSFTAIPDVVGNYQVDAILNPSTFKAGSYVLEASYDQSVTTTKFSVTGKLDTTNKKINAVIDKSVYGLGEKVNLRGTLLTGETSVKITLVKPDGRTDNAGATIDNGKFSWSWVIPQKEFTLADIRDPKVTAPSVFGNYKITISSSSDAINIFFKVSKNPTTDKLEVKPLEVTTDKTVYQAGDKLIVSGNANKKQQTTNIVTGTIPDRVNIQIKSSNNKQILDGTALFDNGGNFQTTFDLPITVFKDGVYKVTAVYQTLRADATFEVKNNVQLGGEGKLALSLATDKETYSPGDTVTISGGTNKVVSLKKLDMTVMTEEDSKVSCGTPNCVGGNKIDLTRYFNNGVFKYDYKLASSAKLGNYVIKIDTELGTFTTTFKVGTKEVQKTEMPLGKISEKFNRIPDPVVKINLFEKKIQNQSVAPSSVQGSLITTRGSEQSVNIKISTSGGTCIIGGDKDCLVSSSTTSDVIDYKVVNFGGRNYKVMYSGPEAVLEKFSIMPEFEEDVIPDSTWTVEIIKGNQPTKFYYEVTYKPIQ